MKLVQLLAKELKEWPENIEFLAQDSIGGVFGWIGRPEYYDDQWILNGDCDIVGFDVVAIDISDDYKSSLVTKLQWQAEREKMNKPKWIRHRGGKCPVAGGTEVETRHRDGKTYSPHFHTKNSRSGVAMNAVWEHKGDALDIMAYRVIEENKDQEIEEVKDTNLGTITYKLEIDATEATQRIDRLVAKWGQIVSPLKWRDEIIELEAYEEEFRREREKLIRKLESEGFKLIDHAPAKCLLDEWEAMDYESFCVGDTVVCINEKSDDTVAELTIGREYRLILDNEELCVIDDAGDAMRYCIEIGCFKLVKRE